MCFKPKIKQPKIETPAPPPTVQASDIADKPESSESKRRKRGFESTKSDLNTILGAGTSNAGYRTTLG